MMENLHALFINTLLYKSPPKGNHLELLDLPQPPDGGPDGCRGGGGVGPRAAGHLDTAALDRALPDAHSFAFHRLLKMDKIRMNGIYFPILQV